MPPGRLPFRDPRTVARDIPGVLDVLFPRLTGGLVGTLNRKAFSFEGISEVPDELVEQSQLQKAMLFELSMARAERLLIGRYEASWDECLKAASERQRRHYDAEIPKKLDPNDIAVADHAARNLIKMLESIQEQHPDDQLEKGPTIPGLGWIASGNGDFALGSTLIEIKHTERNFGSGDFRQVLMYWLLKYAKSIEDNGAVWSNLLLLNPRRNTALLIDYAHLLRSSSLNSGWIELIELLRSMVCPELDRR